MQGYYDFRPKNVSKQIIKNKEKKPPQIRGPGFEMELFFYLQPKLASPAGAAISKKFIF